VHYQNVTFLGLRPAAGRKRSLLLAHAAGVRDRLGFRQILLISLYISVPVNNRDGKVRRVLRQRKDFVRKLF